MGDETNLDTLLKLRGDFPKYSADCLKVRAKDESIKPLILNEAQLEVHRQLEAQKAEKGWIRALILKGRQQGISTYISARYYHRASMRKGVNVYILSHEQMASNNLFDMVDRYQRNNPIAPHAGTSNVKELVFDKLDSSYVVATAGAKEGGRSRTISLFHGSEVAFWLNAPTHFASSVQAVPLMPNTEIILESTSAGAQGEFYERWQDAEAGRSDFVPIFLPWWLTKEYEREPEPGFILQNEADEGEMSEQEYADMYKVSLRKMSWRRAKIIELRDPEMFKREYPADPTEAWTAPIGHDPYIKPLFVMRARKRESQANGPLILGVDPASNGGDRFSIAARRGRKVLWVKYRNKINHIEGSTWVRSFIDELKPARVNVDAGNIGADVVTDLKTIGPYYADLVRGVNFGATSQAKTAKPKVPGPVNRRAEMWYRMREWLMTEEGACLPDESVLQSDITAPRLKPRLNNDYVLESKLDMKARGVRSPDLADAIALTFAFNEYFESYSEERTPQQFGELDRQSQAEYVPQVPAGPTSWMG